MRLDMLDVIDTFRISAADGAQLGRALTKLARAPRILSLGAVDASLLSCIPRGGEQIYLNWHLYRHFRDTFSGVFEVIRSGRIQRLAVNYSTASEEIVDGWKERGELPAMSAADRAFWESLCGPPSVQRRRRGRG